MVMSVLPAPSPIPVMFMAAEIRTEDVLYWAIYLCAIAAVGIAALVWAAFVRKSRKRRKRHHKPPTWQMEPESSPEHGRHRRSSRHRHTHAERLRTNPTLAETGGLPPARPDETDNPPESER